MCNRTGPLASFPQLGLGLRTPKILTELFVIFQTITIEIAGHRSKPEEEEEDEASILLVVVVEKNAETFAGMPHASSKKSFPPSDSQNNLLLFVRYIYCCNDEILIVFA